MRLSDPQTLEDYLFRLQILKQSGIISKTEYEKEKQRITASQTGETGNTKNTTDSSLV